MASRFTCKAVAAELEMPEDVQYETQKTINQGDLNELRSLTRHESNTGGLADIKLYPGFNQL